MPTALILPGTAGNYASAPDSVPLSITSNITLLIRAALDDWTNGAEQTLLGKAMSTGAQRSYGLCVDATGHPILNLSVAGGPFVTATSSAVVPVADGVPVWILVSWRNSDDRCQFFTASGTIDNPAASDFTQLGTDQTLTATGIFNSDATAPLEIGARNAGTVNLAAGKFYRAKIYNGVFSTAAFAGTLQFDADLAAVTVTAVRTPASFSESSANAATVTLNGSAWMWQGGVNLTAATAALSGVAVSPVPQPVTVNLTAASLALTGIAVTAVPGQVTVSLTPASTALGGVAVTPVPQPITVNLTAATVVLSAPATDPQPQPITVNLTAVALALTAVATTPEPQPITVDLTGADVVFEAVELSTSVPAVVSLTVASFTFTAIAVDPVPQPVTVALVSAAVALSAEPVTAEPGLVTVTLTVATLTLAGQALDAQPQPITVALTSASLALTAVETVPVPQPITVALTHATLVLSAPLVTAGLGVVEMTLTPAVLVLLAIAARFRDRNPRRVTFRDADYSVLHRETAATHRDTDPAITYRDSVPTTRRDPADLVYQEG